MKPLCFIIMPFNSKPDAEGNIINFNEIHEKLIRPAVEAAGMEPVRADEETINGIIHKPMYERLILCDYAVADLTTANANVFYELGIRHAVKPWSTINIYAAGSKLPFDLNAVRCMPYHYKDQQLEKLTDDIAALTQQLQHAKRLKATDSPVYQLVDGIGFQNSVAHQKTDIFRDQVTYNKKLKEQLESIRTEKIPKEERLQKLDKLLQEKIETEDEEAGVLIDVMLSYRSLGAFDKMIAFIESLPTHIKNTVMVQEQLGFALNRQKERDKAVKVLDDILAEHGASSETYGILGRVYKDKYDDALKDGNDTLAAAFLNKAIETYQKGFEADWRDAYPGVNALTLLELKGEKVTIGKLAPVVAYAVQQKINQKTPDYWDYATLLEIAVITNDEVMAADNFLKALTTPLEGDWMFTTTINNLDLICEARKKRNEAAGLAEKYKNELQSQVK